MSERETPLPLGYTPPAPKAPQPVSNMRDIAGTPLQVHQTVAFRSPRNGLRLGLVSKIGRTRVHILWDHPLSPTCVVSPVVPADVVVLPGSSKAARAVLQGTRMLTHAAPPLD